MKKLIIAAAAAIVAPMSASADVSVKFPEGKADSVYTVEHMLISDMVRPRAERPMPAIDTLKSGAGLKGVEVDASRPPN